MYGTTWKALITEKFGDGIMSAIDFNMKIEREEDPKGDRVKITMSGKASGLIVCFFIFVCVILTLAACACSFHPVPALQALLSVIVSKRIAAAAPRMSLEWDAQSMRFQRTTCQ